MRKYILFFVIKRELNHSKLISRNITTEEKQLTDNNATFRRRGKMRNIKRHEWEKKTWRGK